MYSITLEENKVGERQALYALLQFRYHNEWRKKNRI